MPPSWRQGTAEGQPGFVTPVFARFYRFKGAVIQNVGLGGQYKLEAHLVEQGPLFGGIQYILTREPIHRDFR